MNDHLYFDGSAETRHAKNIATDPQVSVQLESGDEGNCLSLRRIRCWRGQSS
ncbi:MAG: pyridoxamine 5'-phosphate oxidase family protein [Anaerolineae bacterium]